MKTTDRILYLDLLNIAACPAVICLHHNGLVHTFTGDTVWKECLLAECLFYWAVPVFLMISGANLMTYHKRYSTKEFFKKRILRVLIPWIFWSIILIIWGIFRGRYALSDMSLKEVVHIILNCKVEGVYWFFPLIIGIYSIMPLLACLSDEKFRKILWFTVNLFLVCNATIPLLCSLIGFQWNSSLSVPINGYLIHVILGYLLSTEDISTWKRKCLYVFGVCSFIIHYVGIYALSMRDGAKNSLFFNYNYFFSYGLAIAVFVFFKYVDWDRFIGNFSATISRISSCSLGIFLIHQLIMSFERKLFRCGDYSFFWRTGGIICTYLISLLVVSVIKKIPVLRKAVP